MSSLITELLWYLDDQRVNLRDAVASVPADRHQVSPGEGRWSVANVLEHLSVVENRIAGMLRPKIAQARTLTVPEPNEPVAPPLDVPRVLNRGQRVQATPASLPSGTLDTAAALAALDLSRAVMRETLLGAEGVLPRSITLPHPVFGPLDLEGWIRFVGAHEARHADQIREIGASLGAP